MLLSASQSTSVAAPYTSRQYPRWARAG
jgi:hypothetical protein